MWMFREDQIPSEKNIRTTKKGILKTQLQHKVLQLEREIHGSYGVCILKHHHVFSFKPIRSCESHQY